MNSCADCEQFLKENRCEQLVMEMKSQNLQVVAQNILDLINKVQIAEQIVPTKKGSGKEIHQEEKND